MAGRAVKVPSTPRAESRSAQAPPKISSRADAPTDRYRYHSMPPMPEGNSGLSCRPARLRTMGFFVMIDQRPKTSVLPVLCARAHASVRPVSLCHVLLADSLFRFAARSQPIVCVKDCPVFSRHYAAMLPQVDLLVTIPIDNRRCFTHRFSPTGFILNASDSNCCHPIALGSHSG